MVDHIFSIVKYVKGLILRIGWYTIDAVPDIDTPMLFITGKQDEIVPYEHTIKLYDAATSARFKDILIVDKGTHNDTWYVARDEYLAFIYVPKSTGLHEPMLKYLAKLKEFMDRARIEMVRHRQETRKNTGREGLRDMRATAKINYSGEGEEDL